MKWCAKNSIYSVTKILFQLDDYFSQLQALSNKVDEKCDSVVQAIKTLKEDTRAIHNRINNAEERLSTLEEKLETTSKQVKQHNKKVQQLLQKIDNLESRANRNNLRLA